LRNNNYDKLIAGFLFPEIDRRVCSFLEWNSNRKFYRLCIGNTTEAIPDSILRGLYTAIKKLGSREIYTGYGVELSLD